jgi:hypothetical protein
MNSAGNWHLYLIRNFTWSGIPNMVTILVNTVVLGNNHIMIGDIRTVIHVWGHKLPLYKRLKLESKGRLQSYRIKFETARPNVIIVNYFKCSIPRINFSFFGRTVEIHYVGPATRLRAGRPRVRGSFPGRSKSFFASPQRRDRLWDTAPYPMDIRHSFPGGKADVVSSRPPASI